MLDARRGSGATSLAIGSLAAAQADGGIVAWIDAAGSFDPATAARLGVRLEWLLVVQPAAPAEALEIAGWLARSVSRSSGKGRRAVAGWVTSVSLIERMF
jgi:RecA/RadA recombinase